MSTERQIKIYDNMIYNYNINEIEPRNEPLKVLMCSPEYFDIIDVKNAHMMGQQDKLDKALAAKQWLDLKAIYEELKHENIIEDVLVIDGAEACEDMVFCANQTFPWYNKKVIISKMRHASRQKEVPFFEKYFANLGYECIHLTQASMFEGMGDTIPHSNKKLLYGGYGHRSDPKAYEEISTLLQVPIITLELPNPNFYHLDTCFVPLNDTSVMLCKEAFTEEGLNAIKNHFEQIFYIPEEEAIKTFCLNAHVISNQHNGKKAAILQQGSLHAKAILAQCGYKIYEINTSEFMKSGGSVFCMKMMLY